MHRDPIALGRRGELEAAAYLRRQGYRIVGKNVRVGGVEIDLIATKAQLLSFIEVKTRRGHQQGAPEEAVDARKQARLVRGALAWLYEQRALGRRNRFETIRFDVIACLVNPDESLALRHIEGAFEAGE
jgi:putative endonuclease